MSSELVALQKQLSDFIRDPEQHPGPDGVEARRLAIYRDLFFNTAEGYLCTAFPVTRSLYSEPRWRGLIRAFLRLHHCQSPFFVQLAEEFMAFLSEQHDLQEDDPPFLLELAHYEWVELALDISTETLPDKNAAFELSNQSRLRLSPLAWSLAYHFPVHQISRDFQPAEAGAEVTFLLVYRNRDDRVGFLEINAATHRLLVLLDENAGDVSLTLTQLAAEMNSPLEAVAGFALPLLQDLWNRDILLDSALGGGA